LLFFILLKSCCTIQIVAQIPAEIIRILATMSPGHVYDTDGAGKKSDGVRIP